MRMIVLLTGFLSALSMKAQQVNIIPQPANLKINNGSFVINQDVQIVYDPSTEFSARFLNDYLIEHYKLKCNLREAGNSMKDTRSIYLLSSPGDKGEYKLDVETHSVDIKGDPAGVFYGVQTFIQLLPTGNNISKIEAPLVEIGDEPRFAYRGMHLDVGRHFFPVSFIKEYIDYLALHKMNYFHWHLTEDQGWRIEIKKYPNLTKIGAWRNGTIIGRYPGKGSDDTRYGGFYTQDEIKDVVKYAADRYITVIPEIELPGHSSAAIASYPWLSCFPNEPTKIPANMISKASIDQQAKGQKKLVQETWGVFDDVFCAGKDSTFQFLQDVMDEVLTLFPSKYIHVGGDECPKANWKRCPHCQLRMKNEKLKDEHELQSYFIQRMEKYLNSKGRTLIGWDEILEGGLAPNAVVMSWRGEEGGIAAAKENHNVIMTPQKPVYFDHTQTQNEDSVTIGGFNPIEQVYAYEPVPKELSVDKAKFVLGAQANVWTEYMKNEKKVEYMVFPRMSALSEVLWSQKKNRDWNNFEKRLATQYKRYDLWGANYSSAYYDLKASVIPTENYKGVLWKLESKTKPARISFFKTLTKDDPPSPPPFNDYTVPIRITKSSEYAGWTWVDGKRANSISQKFKFNKATGKKITLTTEPSKNYPGDGAFTLVNGIQNEKGRARSGEFIGFLGDDMEALIDLGDVQQISNVKAHVFQQNPSWIYRPKFMQVLISRDGKIYTEMGITDMVEMTATNDNVVMRVQQKSVAARYIKIKLGNRGVIPEGNPGAGNKAWMWVDEIEVN